METGCSKNRFEFFFKSHSNVCISEKRVYFYCLRSITHFSAKEYEDSVVIGTKTPLSGTF